VATAALTRQGIAYESHAALWVAVMEAPGLVAGILLARWGQRNAARQGTESGATRSGGWGALAHDVLLGKSVLLLMGGLLIGALAGEAGTAPIKAVFIDPFKGVPRVPSATVRTVFIIGPDKKVRLTMSYPMSVGRNFAEILRALDAVQATDGVPIATPANWVPGQDVIVALSLNDAQAKEKFGAIDVKLPYLRFTKAPKK
jgi:hypothetical protein